MDGREQEVECGIGDVATVWDGEIAAFVPALLSVKVLGAPSSVPIWEVVGRSNLLSGPNNTR